MSCNTLVSERVNQLKTRSLPPLGKSCSTEIWVMWTLVDLFLWVPPTFLHDSLRLSSSQRILHNLLSSVFSDLPGQSGRTAQPHKKTEFLPVHLPSRTVLRVPNYVPLMHSSVSCPSVPFTWRAPSPVSSPNANLPHSSERRLGRRVSGADV